MKLTAKEIQSAIAHKHGLEPNQLRKGSRNGGKFSVIVKARAEAMTSIRRELGFSYPMIGRLFGGFHHTTVMHLVAKYGSGNIEYEHNTIPRRVESLERRVSILETALRDQRPEGCGGNCG